MTPASEGERRGGRRRRARERIREKRKWNDISLQSPRRLSFLADCVARRGLFRRFFRDCDQNMISPMVLWTAWAEEAKGLARSYSFSALAIWFSHCPITLSFFRTSLSPSLAQRKTHQQSASTRERATARRPMAKSIKARWGKGGRGNARALSCLPYKKRKLEK